MSEHVIETDLGRLVVSRCELATGRLVVAIAPHFRSGSGAWRPIAALHLPATAATELASAVLAIGAEIAGAPRDPAPTDEDRELSRMP